MGGGQSEQDEEYQIEIKKIESTYKIIDNPDRSRSLRRSIGSGENNQVKFLYMVDKNDAS